MNKKIINNMIKVAAFRPIRDIYTKGMMGRLARNQEALSPLEVDLVRKLSGGNERITDRVFDNLAESDLPGHLGSRMLTSHTLPAAIGTASGIALMLKGKLPMIPITNDGVIGTTLPLTLSGVAGGMGGRFAAARSLETNINKSFLTRNPNNLTKTENDLVDLIQSAAREEKIRHYGPRAAAGAAGLGALVGTGILGSHLEKRKNK